jgi:glycerol uptake facilitator-like aquaporin
MEVEAAHNHKGIVFVYEAVGTGMLLYAINLQNGEIFGQFGIAFMLFAWLLIGGPVTGAHYNPAVSVGILVSNAAMAKEGVMFAVMVAGQFIGAILGVMLAWASLVNNSGNNPSEGGVP